MKKKIINCYHYEIDKKEKSSDLLFEFVVLPIRDDKMDSYYEYLTIDQYSEHETDENNDLFFEQWN